jgi:translation initiation factor IF-3
VVSADGEQLGILPIAQALELARQGEMDLVEVAAEAMPPVCRIMDFGKYKYMQARRQKDARKKQTIIQVKEVKLGPKTDTHDFDFKAKHVRRFLEQGQGHGDPRTRWSTRSFLEDVDEDDGDHVQWGGDRESSADEGRMPDDLSL